jgi:uncharacterized protein (DUF4415 family)
MPTRSKAKRRHIDPDNPPLTDADLRRMRPARDVLPEIFGKTVAKRMLRRRGRPKSDAPRTSISLRLPPIVLERWKAKGPGWQTRMVALLSRVR